MASTKIIDRESGEIVFGKVPPYSVVVPGSLPGKISNDDKPSPSLYCAVIVKKDDAQTLSKSSITQKAGFEGVDGIFRFNSNGTNERGLAIALVENKQVKIIDPAPTFFGSAGF